MHTNPLSTAAVHVTASNQMQKAEGGTKVVRVGSTASRTHHAQNLDGLNLSHGRAGARQCHKKVLLPKKIGAQVERGSVSRTKITREMDCGP